MCVEEGVNKCDMTKINKMKNEKERNIEGTENEYTYTDKRFGV